MIDLCRHVAVAVRRSSAAAAHHNFAGVDSLDLDYNLDCNCSFGFGCNLLDHTRRTLPARLEVRSHSYSIALEAAFLALGSSGS